MKDASTCYHCGECCPSHSPVLEEKRFCCEGCKTVYEVLGGHGLANYYQLASNPGINASGKKQPHDYSYLDEAEAFEKLINFRQGDRVHIHLRIPQIHCASCVWLLEHLYKIHSGILSSEVRFLKKRLYLQFDLQQIKLSEIAKIIADLGYAPDINLQDLDAKKNTTEDRSFYYKLGIAGFCAGNIMLLSFPEYLGLEDLSFKNFFTYLNLVLTLPIIFYSGMYFLKSAYQGLKMGNLNIDVPISLRILALFSQSLFEILTQSGPGYLDSLAGLVFFLLLGRWFQQKSYEQLNFERDFRSYFPLYAQKIEKGEKKAVLLSNLQEGDLLHIQPGEIVPADAVLIDKTASMDYSFVSGESAAVEIQQHEHIFAGGKLLSKSVEVCLLKPVSESYLSELWKGYKKSNEEKDSIQQLTDKLAKHFTLTVLFLASIAALYWWIQSDLAFALEVAIAVLIVACPCGLALAAPIVLGNSMRILGNQGFFLKDSKLLESIPKIKYWVFDKTGTLTLPQQNDSLTQLHSLSREEQSMVLALARESRHPVSKAIAQELAGVAVAELESSKEYPGAGLIGYTQEHHIAIGKEFFLRSTLNSQLENGSTGIAIDGRIIAEIDRQEAPRKGLIEVLKNLGQDFQLSLLTGDTKSRALNLREFFPEESHFYWEKLPDEKLAYIKEIQEKGEKVIMMGDGLNDAGALMRADLGIVLSEQLESFSPASDVILDSKSFSLLPQLISYARNSQKLLKAALIISLLYNIIGLSFAIQGLLSPLIAAILMPLSSISVIAWGMGSTHLLARKMGIAS
ncbi:MAG: heavy metal translocating P-type ATPase metal-binding domain-containing protein [Bacteroidota bacterium]